MLSLCDRAAGGAGVISAVGDERLIVGGGGAPSTARVLTSGKFFELDGCKWYLKGLTYGPFAPREDGLFLPVRNRVRDDFAMVRAMGANCVRVYHRPPAWLLDEALEHELRVFVDVPWEKHRCFFEDWPARQAALREVQSAARELGSHPGLFAISVANEFPADVVRFYGQARLARFVDELIDTVKQHAPQCPTTFANYPTTEFLRPSAVDFLCFNVYLEEERSLARYLDRLQHLAGSKPLILGEFGVDSYRHGEERQGEMLAQHVRTVFQHGLAGSFVFSFTDDWFTGGHQIEDWAFGITRRDRSIKPGAAALRKTWAMAPRLDPRPHGSISVVVCSYNGASTLRECLTSLMELNYPDYEVILVDDGSTDETRSIAADFPDVRYIHQENRGLSVARNVGAAAASGDIVAYTDSDCVADPDWLHYLADAMRRQNVKAIGGPNFPPPSDNWTAKCVAASPGGPSHVMLDDQRAEHVPGCNIAFDRKTLLELGGFDPQFRQAGDDVDICWRLLEAGHAIGFAASAVVWHHRRNTVRAFLKQQKGYGRSEAMLIAKHAQRFNRLGCSLWRGIIYGEGAVGLSTAEPVVFHGRYGSGLFQTIYHQNAYSAWGYFTLLEWHAIAALLLALSVLAPLLASAAALMWALTLVAAIRSAVQSPLPRSSPWWCRPVVLGLHIAQPIVRSAARYRHRMRTRRLPRVRLLDGAEPVQLKPIRTDTRDAYWQSDQGIGREDLLAALEDQAARSGWRGNFNEEWQPWDVYLFGDWWHSISLRTATEELGGKKRFTRVRCTATATTFAWIVACVSVVAGLVALAASKPFVLAGLGLLLLVVCVRTWISRRRCFMTAGILLANAAYLAGLDRVKSTIQTEAATTGDNDDEKFSEEMDLAIDPVVPQS